MKVSDLLPETTPAFLVRRTGLDDATLHKRLNHPDCPPWLATKRGLMGRLIKLRLSQEAFDYLSRPPEKRGTRTTSSPMPGTRRHEFA